MLFRDAAMSVFVSNSVLSAVPITSSEELQDTGAVPLITNSFRSESLHSKV